jgi:hypothetical protein
VTVVVEVVNVSVRSVSNVTIETPVTVLEKLSTEVIVRVAVSVVRVVIVYVLASATEVVVVVVKVVVVDGSLWSVSVTGILRCSIKTCGR